jgi:hypothetical protein
MNGFPISENIPLNDGDEVVFVEKGRIPDEILIQDFHRGRSKEFRGSRYRPHGPQGRHCRSSPGQYGPQDHIGKRRGKVLIEYGPGE